VASRLAHDVRGRLVVADESGLWFVVLGNCCRAGDTGVYLLEEEARRARQAREQLRQARAERLERNRTSSSASGVAANGNGPGYHGGMHGAVIPGTPDTPDPHS
jgi:hypothetical protein